MCHRYIQHVVSTLWKRRNGTLIILSFFTTCVFLVQYRTVAQNWRNDQVLPRKTSVHRNLQTLDRRQNASDVISAWNNGGDEYPVPTDDQVVSRKKRRIFKRVRANRGPDDSVKTKLANAGHGGLIKNGDEERTFYPAAVVPQLINRNVDSNFQLNVGRIPRLGQQMYMPAGKPYVPTHRIVHFDFKGAPPKVSYFAKIFPMLRELGATGILLEYEDAFPFTGILKNTVVKNHYTLSDIEQIKKLAVDNSLMIIPLVQTFGHLEFVLKIEDFVQLREVPNAPQSICPSRNASVNVVHEIIDQVMAVHKDVMYLHIGCDEVFQLGVCYLCSLKNRDDVFLSHVAEVAHYVRDKYKVIPIIWDDMLRHYSPQVLKKHKLGELVEPMVWTYVSDIYRFIPQSVWTTYGAVFPFIWTASAFKGAFGETLMAPNVKMHLENNIAWLQVMEAEKHRFKGEFRGITLTGWQRYDHFAVLCELLPAAMPSLAMSLVTLSHGFYNDSWMEKLYDGLQCMKAPKYRSLPNLDTDPFLFEKMNWCFFPGVAFFHLTERIENVKKTVGVYIKRETVDKAWLTEFNVRHNFSSISRIDSALEDFVRHNYDVETLIKQSRDALREVFDEYTVAEWIEQNVYPMLRKLELLRDTAESLKKPNVWPVRPFSPHPELQRYNIGIPDGT